MNETLPERSRRGRRGRSPDRSEAEVWILPPQLNARVKQYFDRRPRFDSAASWLDYEEVPTSAEILDLKGATCSESDIVELMPNRPNGPWESKETYLAALYGLLREDAVRPIREAVVKVRDSPNAAEENFDRTIGIYEKVQIIAVTLSPQGIATRVTFSTARTGRKVKWEQSKRLVSGSLVVLTPASDMFQTKAIVATVAARSLKDLQQNPPELDLFFARAEELEIDPAVEWVMVEERSAYFEAERHVLLALQKMMTEKFPLSEHIVSVQENITAPTYILRRPRIKMHCMSQGNESGQGVVDVLNHWPTSFDSLLDASQLGALRRILTKRLAIIQGPPGTGKTFVSIEAIKVMLENHEDGDPPIVITSQTNHALDQLLRHIAKFEPDFVRLGGRSKDTEVVKRRTLFEVRKETAEDVPTGSAAPGARRRMRGLEKEIVTLLSDLEPGEPPLDIALLRTYGLISEAQVSSLEAGASEWVQTERSTAHLNSSPLTIWLGQDLNAVPYKPPHDELGFEYEETEFDFEQLKEAEAEALARDDEASENLHGRSCMLAENFTCRKVPGVNERKVKDLLKEQNLWTIPELLRGAVFRFLQTEAKKKLVEIFRVKAKAFNEAALQRKIGNWEKDETILRKQKIIGMTTTGFSKYRGLIAALKPRIVLIEEAAETLEAPVTATCIPSLEHLVLVGDQQQLRPHCHVKQLEDGPFYANISLFERMLNNQVEYDMLVVQRRMIPEIRRLLFPIYEDKIKDHISVRERADVPGMGGINTFFFTHQWPEQRDDYMSCVNSDEAEMIIGFIEHLVYNGMETEHITVLTFYNGQRKQIIGALRKSMLLAGEKFNVYTVDSYQGEENEVVILSLVRSNDMHQIGFLSVVNRICVALSRAQKGFYLFGNGMLLYKLSKTWRTVIDIMSGNKNKKERPKLMPCRLDQKLPVHCAKHGCTVHIEEPGDWNNKLGGCQRECDERLPCGHTCELLCHPFSHDQLRCRQPCPKTLGCGHTCRIPCAEMCWSTVCNEKQSVDVGRTDKPVSHNDPGKSLLSSPGNSHDGDDLLQNELAPSAVPLIDIRPNVGTAIPSSASWSGTLCGGKDDTVSSDPKTSTCVGINATKDWSKDSSLLD